MTTNGHAPAADPHDEGTAARAPSLPGYLVIVHPAGDLDAPHLARYWTEVPALAACTADGSTVEQAVEATRATIARWLAAQGGGLTGFVAAFGLSVELAF